jgi:hypothetical protein
LILKNTFGGTIFTFVVIYILFELIINRKKWEKLF